MAWRKTPQHAKMSKEKGNLKQGTQKNFRRRSLKEGPISVERSKDISVWGPGLERRQEMGERRTNGKHGRTNPGHPKKPGEKRKIGQGKGLPEKKRGTREFSTLD